MAQTASYSLSVSNSFPLLLLQVHEAKWSPQPSAKHKNPWNYTSILPHILTGWRLCTKTTSH